jgi:hypothetical protein
VKRRPRPVVLSEIEASMVLSNWWRAVGGSVVGMWECGLAIRRATSVWRATRHLREDTISALCPGDIAACIKVKRARR